MAGNREQLPLVLRIHNVICPAWRFRVGALRKVCPGCRAMQKHLDRQKQPG